MNKNEKQILSEEEEIEQLIKSLPKVPYMGSNVRQLINFDSFWCNEFFLRNTIKCRKRFIPKESDKFIASMPKTGTTWLKSILFSIVNRNKYPINQSPLLNNNPHNLVYGLETQIYSDELDFPSQDDVDRLTSPRLLSTHLSYKILPESIKSLNCKIIYIARNPSDTIASTYHFSIGIIEKLSASFNHPPFEDFFDNFCQRKCSFGPYFENVLEYWKLSLEQPDTMLFLKYEDLMSDPVPHIKRMAEFIGMPFSSEDVNGGVVEDIVELCSFKKMKELDVNKSGIVIQKTVDKKDLFRKGEVGDWTNYFSQIMEDKINTLMELKFKDTGLSFDMNPK